MAAIEWRDDRNVGIGFMDHDHLHAATLINQMAAAEPAARLDLLDSFIAHCRDHFAREEAMMARTRFFATHCHAGEHERVLAELDDVRKRLAGGDPQQAYFERGLPDWLNEHRDTMDFVTAEFARKTGEQ